MTTLSKEDIVQMDSESGLYVYHNGDADVEQLQAFATLARADIVEANKALVAENGRLKKQLRQQAEAIASTINKHHTELAAAEAREANLRDALDNHSGNYKLSKDECAKVNALLDAPRDDSALRRLLAEAKAGVYEECAKVCENSDRYRGDYFAAKILELAEKAKE